MEGALWRGACRACLPLFEFFSHTSLMTGEVVALGWCDFDLAGAAKFGVASPAAPFAAPRSRLRPARPCRFGADGAAAVGASEGDLARG
jgi:hypothetical protein